MTTRKSILVGTAVVAAAALWYLFRPDALVISKTVNQPLPAAEHSMSSAMAAEQPRKLAGVVGGTAAAIRRLPPTPSVGGTPAPELTNTSWLNADQPLRLSELHGRVVLLNFWVFTCGNCTRTVPSLVAYDRLYRERGLTIIGIHTPEFPRYAGEHDKGNLARALRRQDIAYPNAQDNDRRRWDAYDIHYWHSFSLI